MRYRAAIACTVMYSALLAALFLPALGTAPTAHAQENLMTVRTLADKRVPQLPTGALSWRVERFPSLAEAQAAAGPHGVATEMGGVAYVATLAGDGAPPPRGTVVAQIAPLVRPTASEYRLELTEVAGPPGSRSTIHSHPGIESYFVAGGELTVRSLEGSTTLRPGESSPGVPGGAASELLNTGSDNLLVLVLFAVDAMQPLSAPATLPSTGPAIGEGTIILIAALLIVGIGIVVIATARFRHRGTPGRPR